MRAKSLALLMLALGCGLVASIGVTQLMAKRNAEPRPTGEAQSILVAVKDIPLGDRLSAEMLKLEAWPKDKVPAGAVSKMEEIDGCRTRTTIYAGEPILEKKLLGKGDSRQGDSSMIPLGLRVVPVKVDNVSGGPGLIMPGDRVDVLVHLVRDPQHDIHETATRTILEDIKVFAVDDMTSWEHEKDSKDGKEKITAKTISLLVTPAQAAKLTLATEMGKVRLVMRPPGDKGASEGGTASPDELFGGAKKADRNQERLFVPDEPKKAKSSGLADFLKSMKNQLDNKPRAPAATTPIVPNETFKMLILQPNGINEVLMESVEGPEAARMPNGGWQINSTSMTSMNGGNSGGETRLAGPPPTVTPSDKPATKPADPPGDAADGPALGPKEEPKIDPDPQESSPGGKGVAAEPSGSSGEGNG